MTEKRPGTIYLAVFFVMKGKPAATYCSKGQKRTSVIVGVFIK